MVADAFALLARVKAVRDDQHVFLNDGVYGTLAEVPLMGMVDRLAVLSPQGARRSGEGQRRVIFGPTCDSVDRLPGETALPADMEEGDFLLVRGMGAYSTVTNTRFNGFGAVNLHLALNLEG